MIDTHAHLNFKAFENDEEAVIKRARSKGLEAIVNVGSNLETSEKAVAIAQRFDDCWATVGIHPIHWEDTEILGYDDIKRRLGKLARKPKVVAIGETGLDYYHLQVQNSKFKIQNYNLKLKIEEIKERQKKLFSLHLELARELNLPLIIHNREAHEEVLSILKQLTINNQQSAIKGVFHCFSGTKEFLKEVLGMGFYVGFDGNITYKSAQDLRELVKATPLDRLLLETDCPYLTPEPLRNQRNEPQNVKIIANLVADLKGLTLTKVDEVTTANAKTLFQI